MFSIFNKKISPANNKIFSFNDRDIIPDSCLTDNPTPTFDKNCEFQGSSFDPRCGDFKADVRYFNILSEKQISRQASTYSSYCSEYEFDSEAYLNGDFYDVPINDDVFINPVYASEQNCAVQQPTVKLVVKLVDVQFKIDDNETPRPLARDAFTDDWVSKVSTPKLNLEDNTLSDVIEDEIICIEGQFQAKDFGNTHSESKRCLRLTTVTIDQKKQRTENGTIGKQTNIDMQTAAGMLVVNKVRETASVKKSWFQKIYSRMTSYGCKNRVDVTGF